MNLTAQQKEIINNTKKFIEKRKNKFPKGEDMLSHNKNVEKFAIEISRKYKNIQIFPLMLAAHLHDIGLSESSDHEKHATIGYDMTKKYLEKYNLITSDQIELAALCALNHRGDKKIKRSIEERIISSAAAMDFVDRALFLFTEKCKHNEYKDAVIWIQKILNKIMARIELPEARKIIKPKYEAAKRIFELENI
jgi:hypothetical protein